MIISIDLKPYGNFPKSWDFVKQVSCLRRPYIKIEKSEYDKLFSQNVDVFSNNDSLFSFGNADQGFALMPIAQEHIKKINPLN